MSKLKFINHSTPEYFKNGAMIKGAMQYVPSLGFVFGGWANIPGRDTVQYGEIYILTLLAFHWIQVSFTAEKPRCGHTCGHVSGSHILTVGGADVNLAGFDHFEHATSGTPDPFKQDFAILDMASLTFQSQCNSGAPPYEQSDMLKHFHSQPNGSYLENLTAAVAALLNTTHSTNCISSCLLFLFEPSNVPIIDGKYYDINQISLNSPDRRHRNGASSTGDKRDADFISSMPKSQITGVVSIWGRCGGVAEMFVDERPHEIEDLGLVEMDGRYSQELEQR
ncbi:hypothetical protein MMC21_000298 [Puttea exsequens]|nr:hypothetical protein [Puttea exsequens]